ncbi:MAG TPA: GcrA family cell cycle regulator [Methylocystis sp.]|nr:GcrA family cell cycle regulator [Methylocystis sp.]
MTWTEERVELLRKLWREGRSAAQVAAALGSGVTRNAVIGKIHRLGLADRSSVTGVASSAPRVRAARAPRAQTAAAACTAGPAAAVLGNVALALAPQFAVVADPLTQSEVVVPITARVTLMDLREAMCRWPLGDPSTPDFRFCGVKSRPGSGPYCSHHASIAYQPAHERRRREGGRGAF